MCKFCLLGARDGSALQPPELPVKVDVATDAEVDSIIRAMRMKSESESGLVYDLLLHSVMCCKCGCC